MHKPHQGIPGTTDAELTHVEVHKRPRAESLDPSALTEQDLEMVSGSGVKAAPPPKPDPKLSNVFLKIKLTETG